MAQTLYELKSGKITRKDHKGEYVTNRSPFKFVPSPGELAANKWRLMAVGTVDDASDEVKAAKLNTNWDATPDAFGGDCGVAPAVLPKDIRSVKKVEDALATVAAVTDTVTLDTYQEQELGNKPRIRKVILVAIDSRKKELMPVTEEKKVETQSVDTALLGE